MIFKWKDLVKHIKKYSKSKKRKFLYISSFGLSFDKELVSLLETVKPDKLLVGFSDHLCHDQCQCCIGKVKYRYDNLLKLKQLNIKLVKELHLKLILTNEVAIIGGMNLSSSSWDDCMIILQDKKSINKLKEKFLKLWKTKRRFKLPPMYQTSKPSTSEKKYYNSSSRKLFSGDKNNRYILFGKYKGFTITQIKSFNPQYLEWCNNNIPDFKKQLEA